MGFEKSCNFPEKHTRLVTILMSQRGVPFTHQRTHRHRPLRDVVFHPVGNHALWRLYRRLRDVALGQHGVRVGRPGLAASGYLGGLTLATLNTLLLITSSFTMVRAVLASEEKNASLFAASWARRLLLGLGFLAVKIFEYYLKIHHGYYPRSEFMEATPGLNIFISFYFVLTGFHGLHVLIGVLWNYFLFKRGKGLWTSASVAKSNTPDFIGTSSTRCGCLCFRSSTSYE
jgi:hypothetical protein